MNPYVDMATVFFLADERAKTGERRAAEQALLCCQELVSRVGGFAGRLAVLLRGRLRPAPGGC